MFILPIRKNDSYKKDYGRILIIAGNSNYGGAAILAARAALFSGAGLITLASHPCNHNSLHSQQPEIMVLDWEDNLVDHIKDSDTILIGPGLGTDEKAKDIFKRALESINREQILILDASALHLFGQVLLPPCKLVLTPHLGEMRVLSGLNTEEINDHSCLEFSRTNSCYLILKGHKTKLYFKDQIHENIAGSPAMATGGTGDVLAGMIAGFCGQFEIELALKGALYLHSKIALDLAKNNYVVLPSRIINEIPKEMKKLESRITRV